MLCTLLLPALALGRPNPTARLEYTRKPSALDCPDKAELEAAISAKLGFNPFVEPAQLVIEAEVERTEAGRKARMFRLNEQGARLSERSLVSSASDCRELTESLVLALSIAIDPLSATRPLAMAHPPAPSPPPPPPPPRGEPATKPAPPAPTIGPELQVGLGALGTWGAAPRIAPGVAAHLAARWSSMSIGIEGRADLPVAMPVAERGSIEAALLVGSVVPCFHRGWFAACASMSAGVLRSSGIDLEDSRHASSPSVAVGARLVGEVPIGKSFSARAHLDAAAPLIRTTLRVDEREIWRNPPVSASLGIGVAWSVAP